MLWYLAYGSNMQTATFRGRRGIEPIRAVAARLPDWRLVLDKPPLFPIGESFASVVRESGAEVYGVAYQIWPSDHSHIELTEGVAIGNYESVDVEIELLDGTGIVPASTLTSSKRNSEFLPSTRYLAMIIEGAIEHSLPEPYIEWLRTHPSTRPSAMSEVFRPLVDQFLKK